MKKVLFSTNNVTDDDGFWVSDCDYEKVNARTWCTMRNPNGPMGITAHAKKEDREEGYEKDLSIHRYIMGLKHGDKRVVDHIDGNRLNNTRENLRICSQQENTRNRKLNKNSSTGYKGVTWNKQTKKYTADIRLGSFGTAEEAYKAYCDAADKIFGEFARHK